MNEWMNEWILKSHFQQHLIWETSLPLLYQMDHRPDNSLLCTYTFVSSSWSVLHYISKVSWNQFPLKKKNPFLGPHLPHFRFKLLGWRSPCNHSLTQLGFISRWGWYEQVESPILEGLPAWTGRQTHRQWRDNSGHALTRMQCIFIAGGGAPNPSSEWTERIAFPWEGSCLGCFKDAWSTYHSKVKGKGGGRTLFA